MCFVCQVVQSAPPVWENHLNRTAPYGYLGEFKAGQRVSIQLDAMVSDVFLIDNWMLFLSRQG